MSELQSLRFRALSTKQLSLLAGLILPARQATGSLTNYRRSRLMAAAMHQWRVSRLTPRGQKGHNPGCSLCRVRLRWRGGKAPWKR